MGRQQQNGDQSVDSNQSVKFQYLTTKIYEQLLRSFQLAKTFISGLGPLRDTSVIDSLASYGREMKLSYKSWQSILDLMEIRLNKMIKNNKLKKNWSTDDLEVLVWLLSKYLEKQEIASHQEMIKDDWHAISQMIPGTTPKSCMFKFVSMKKFKLAQHKWQKDEESLLLRIIEQIGTFNWKLISEKLYEKNLKRSIFRTAKQCREHWSCYLDPNLKKGPWQHEEDKKLLQTVLNSKCQKKWSTIKLEFEGRTQNALKNRFNLLLEKQKKLTPHKNEMDLITQILKESEENYTESKIDSESQERNKIVCAIPLIPQQRRNLMVPLQNGLIWFFTGAPINCE